MRDRVYIELPEGSVLIDSPADFLAIRQKYQSDRINLSYSPERYPCCMLVADVQARETGWSMAKVIFLYVISEP